MHVHLWCSLSFLFLCIGSLWWCVVCYKTTLPSDCIKEQKFICRGKKKSQMYVLFLLFEYEHKTITAKRQVDQHFIIISLSGEDAWGCTVKTFICKQFWGVLAPSSSRNSKWSQRAGPDLGTGGEQPSSPQKDLWCCCRVGQESYWYA